VRAVLSKPWSGGALGPREIALQIEELDHGVMHLLERLGIGYASCMECGMAGSVCETRNLRGPEGVIRLTALAKAAG